MFSATYKFFFGIDQDLGLGLGHRTREHIFVKFNLFAIMILLVFLMLNYFAHKWMANVVNLITLGILLMNARFFVLKRELSVATFVFSLSIVFLTSINHLLAPSYLSANVLWLIVMIMVTHVMAEFRYTLILTLLGVTLFSLAYAIPIYYAVPHDKISEADALIINIALIIFSSLSVFYVIYQFKLEELRIRKSLELSRDKFKTEMETTASLVALVTHDLASPITVLKGYLHSLSKKGSLEDDKTFEGMTRSLQTVEDIISDVRVAIACENGKLQLELKEVNLYGVVEHLISDITAKAQEKNIEIKLLVEDSIKDKMIWAEQNSLRNSVLNNLISNAIKFSYRNSSIEIRIQERETVILMDIEDHGVGISNVVEGHLFDFGHPTTRLGTEGEKGTGFGLPLVKMFMDRYQGEVSVVSRVGKNSGTKFTLKFRTVK